MPPTPNIKNMKKYENYQNINLQKLIILEGFRQNGLQIWIQLIFWRIIAPVEIDFRHLFDYDICFDIESLKTI